MFREITRMHAIITIRDIRTNDFADEWNASSWWIEAVSKVESGREYMYLQYNGIASGYSPRPFSVCDDVMHAAQSYSSIIDRMHRASCALLAFRICTPSVMAAHWSLTWLHIQRSDVKRENRISFCIGKWQNNQQNNAWEWLANYTSTLHWSLQVYFEISAEMMTNGLLAFAEKIPMCVS